MPPSPRKALQLMGLKTRSHISINNNGWEQDLEEGPDDVDSEVAPLIFPSSLANGSHKNMVHKGETDALVVQPDKVDVKVLGMTCAACSNSVEKALLKLDGVISATVALLQNRAVVEYDPVRVKEEHIKEAIEDAGFDAEILVKAVAVPVSAANKSTATGRFRITGLSCAACVASVEGILLSLDGVSSAAVGLASSMGDVRYDPHIVDKNEIVAAINDAGFEAEFLESEKRNKVQLIVAGMLSDEDGKVVQDLFYQMQGLKEFIVEPLLERAEVTFDPEVIGLRAIVDAVENRGEGRFRVSLSDLHSPYSPDGKAEAAHFLWLLRWSLIFSVSLCMHLWPLFYNFFFYLNTMCTYHLGLIYEGFKPYLRDDLECVLLWQIPVLFLGIICPQISVFHHLLTLRFGPFVLVDWLKWVLVTPVQFVIGRRFYLGAYRSLRNVSANMDVLVALGTTSAYVYSFFALIYGAITENWLVTYFETTVMLINFILFGKYLEVVAKGKTSEAIGKLLKLAPTTAILLTLNLDGNPTKEREIDAQLVERGDTLKVFPGSKVPADGLIIWGSSHIDESMITGEAIPVAKVIGDNVIGGTLNTNGSLHIRVTRVGSEASLAKIVDLVETAQMVKAPIQKFADFVASIFVPLVVSLAFLTWFCWYVAGRSGLYSPTWLPHGTNDFVFSLMFSISVLVIACPCALGLATPTAVMVATGVGATNGVLIKGGDVLERAQSIRCIVFDKTGTLTKGKPCVTSVKMFSDMKLIDFLEMVASAEADSEHPLAKAIVQYMNGESFSEEEWTADGLNVKNTDWLRKVSAFETIPGKGVRCVVDSRNLLVGNRKLLQDAGVDIPFEAEEHLLEIEQKARSEVLVAVDGRLEGIFGVADPLKVEAAVVVAGLKRMGISSIMVTGDNWTTAKAVAREAGIDRVIAEVLPGEKAETIRKLQKDGSIVAMVGDGINDSPALAVADVGMAVGTGTDIAIEAANFVLMRSSLEGVVTAIDLSRKTFSRIRLNYLFAVGYNVLALPVAAGALYPAFKLRLPPWAAGAAMAFSSVTVVCSSLLLKRYRRPQLLNLVQVKVQ